MRQRSPGLTCAPVTSRTALFSQIWPMVENRRPPISAAKGCRRRKNPGERLPYLTKAGFSTGNIRSRREAKSVIMPDRDHGGR